jgi:hypothetical protein
VCAKFVPYILTEDQMGIRKVVANELFEQSMQETDLWKIIAENESWVFI